MHAYKIRRSRGKLEHAYCVRDSLSTSRKTFVLEAPLDVSMFFPFFVFVHGMMNLEATKVIGITRHYSKKVQREGSTAGRTGPKSHLMVGRVLALGRPRANP